MMSSWVYVFSQFTPEALLLEALGICLLCGWYATYWMLRKRRLGVIRNQVPATVVKTYLTELISDAEQMRSQLFGLLRSTGVRVSQDMVKAAMAPTSSGEAPVVDPALVERLAELEAKMTEQNQAITGLASEKKRLEVELGNAKKAQGARPAAPGGAGDAELRARIGQLEAKLAEYSVIEDDLANLKRLQQENAQLKAQLGGGVAGSAAAPAAPANAPAGAGDVAALAAAEAGAEAAKTAAPDAAFEGIVDQVEQSLAPPEASQPAPPEASQPAPPPAAAPAARAAPAATPTKQAAAPVGTPGDKSDADLVAEFEKMLNN